MYIISVYVTISVVIKLLEPIDTSSMASKLYLMLSLDVGAKRKFKIADGSLAKRVYFKWALFDISHQFYGLNEFYDLIFKLLEPILIPVQWHIDYILCYCERLVGRSVLH